MTDKTEIGKRRIVDIGEKGFSAFLGEPESEESLVA